MKVHTRTLICNNLWHFRRCRYFCRPCRRCRCTCCCRRCRRWAGRLRVAAPHDFGSFQLLAIVTRGPELILRGLGVVAVLVVILPDAVERARLISTGPAAHGTL